MDASKKFQKALPLAMLIGLVFVGGLVSARYVADNWFNNISDFNAPPTEWEQMSSPDSFTINEVPDYIQITTTTTSEGYDDDNILVNVDIMNQHTSATLTAGYTVSIMDETLTTTYWSDTFLTDAIEPSMNMSHEFTCPPLDAGTYKTAILFTSISWN